MRKQTLHRNNGSSTHMSGWANNYQIDLLRGAYYEEPPGYLTEQLITYIGNKRSLIPEIDKAITRIKKRLGKNKLRILDAFSGSGVVSRYFKRHTEYLATIDIEDYATVISRCYLTNKSAISLNTLFDYIDELNSNVDVVDLPKGFIEELYAPQDENNITKYDRVFYTRNNAKLIDDYRRLIERYSYHYKNLLIGPLLSEASIHANTAGVFKGFYKNRETKVGQFGGTNGDALKRILGDIKLVPPILSNYECEVEVFQGDVNVIAPEITDLDVVYLDPPYNQHPYGSNYFMLNLIVNYQKPTEVSKVSGIPVNWRRSNYNRKTHSLECFHSLIKALQTKYIIVSFNNEGFIKRNDIMSILKDVGKVEVIDIKYNTFRGCRNLKNRSIHVTEQMFITEIFD